MDTQTILIIIVVIVAAISLWIALKNKSGELTPVVVANTVRESVPVAKELMEIVQIGVNSAEQLKREGKILTNDVAFNHVLDYIKRWVPDEWEVSNEDIITAINAAVLVASATRREAGASSENAKISG
jgi:hypothetical protein